MFGAVFTRTIQVFYLYGKRYGWWRQLTGEKRLTLTWTWEQGVVMGIPAGYSFFLWPELGGKRC